MLGRMVCLALVCLTLGVRGETPQSPWPALTPTTQPVKSSFDNGHAIAQLALTMEEEILVEMLPFKPPFKMDKKQMAVILKLLKKAVKPILKSERLRTMVAIVDDFMQDLEYDQDKKKYYAGMLDAAQDVHREVTRMYNAEQTDEAQARTFETISNIYRSSVLNNWIVRPFNDWIVLPITTRISHAAERVYNLIPDNSWVVDTSYINPFSRWSETFNYYVNQFSNWSARARNTLEATARLLEEQETGRHCAGCGSHSDHLSTGIAPTGSPGTGTGTDTGVTDIATGIQVIDLTWVLPVIAIIAVGALVASAGGVAAAIAIPLGVVGGLGGFTGTAPVLTGTGISITGTATNFGQGGIGRQDSHYAYDTPEHIRRLVDNIDDSLLDDSDWGVVAVQYSSNNHKAAAT